MILIITILMLVWFVFSSLDGFIQAHYYDLFPKHRNLHIFYVIQRAIVSLAMSAIVFLLADLIYSGVFLFCLMFTFSFFHNGFYYLTRHKLNKNVYPKGFFDESSTSEAILEFGFRFRTAMAIIGGLLTIGLLLQ